MQFLAYRGQTPITSHRHSRCSPQRGAYLKKEEDVMDYREDYDRGRRHRGEGYDGGYYDAPSERDWERQGEDWRHRGDDRGVLERAGARGRSGFGDREGPRPAIAAQPAGPAAC